MHLYANILICKTLYILVYNKITFQTIEKRTMSRTKRQSKDKTNPYKSIPFYETLAMNTNMLLFMYLLYVNGYCTCCNV